VYRNDDITLQSCAFLILEHASFMLSRLEIDSQLAGLLDVAFESPSSGDFLKSVVMELAGGWNCSFLAIVRAEPAGWQFMATTSLGHSIPTEVCTEALDGESVIIQGDLFAAPLALDNLVLLGRSGSTAKQEVSVVASALGAALGLVRRRENEARHVQRLQAILAIAAQWNQTLEMDALLEQMAEASTRLLSAERASIFIWDRANKSLVGRPALGVEEGELRIADNVGVVGSVVQSGESRRVDAKSGEQEIDRDVDKQLSFHTRNLLCVPLRGKRRELFGAFELINKIDGDFTAEDETALTELAAHAAVAIENTQSREQLIKVRDQFADEAMQGAQLIGESPAIDALRSTIGRVADTDLSVLVLGENGTGKEVIAKRVHYQSSRRNEPFVAVNCAALTETLLESELFGHEKGAFTDAHQTRIGKFELASGGTLFLDEIGDMSLGGQAKLLRVLEDKTIVRVGGSLPIHTDARVIAATNRKLVELVREKKFREDLFFRLNVVTVELPPLRERGDDILMLADHFFRSFCAKAGRPLPQFTAAGRKRLIGHAWPGNVRELRNLTERLAYLSQSDEIDADELASILTPDDQESPLMSLELPLVEATRHFQVEYIKKQVERSRGNMTDVAQRLGLHRSNLYRKMRQLEMDGCDAETET
jgi:Nif-specific regulatory protein